MTDDFGSTEHLEKHAREYHGLTFAQFKTMCEEAHERFEGQFSSSTDKALAVESFYDGFKVGCKHASNEWISVKDRMPDYIEGKDYSENVLAMYSVGENTSYMGIFNLVIVEYTEDGHQWAWGKLDSCYSDIRDSEPEWDDDYEVTHWMPLPTAPEVKNV